MTSKYCTKCSELKPLDDFYKRKASIDGMGHICKDCSNKSGKVNRRTALGHIKRKYVDIKKRTKKRGYAPPNFTVKELISWAFNNGYHELHSEWALSGYDVMLSPSFDRTDDYQGYCLTRLRLVTWRENNEKGHADRKSGVNNKANVAVNQLSKSGELICRHHSINQAARKTKALDKHIASCCLKRRYHHTAGGFKWEYATEDAD